MLKRSVCFRWKSLEILNVFNIWILGYVFRKTKTLKSWRTFPFFSWKYYNWKHNVSMQNSISRIPLSINSLHSNLHLLLFQRFIFLLSLVLNIRLNTLTFMFLITLGTHNFAYESLLLLQLRLHWFASILVKM